MTSTWGPWVNLGVFDSPATLVATYKFGVDGDNASGYDGTDATVTDHFSQALNQLNYPGSPYLGSPDLITQGLLIRANVNETGTPRVYNTSSKATAHAYQITNAALTEWIGHAPAWPTGAIDAQYESDTAVYVGGARLHFDQFDGQGLVGVVGGSTLYDATNTEYQLVVSSAYTASDLATAGQVYDTAGTVVWSHQSPYPASPVGNTYVTDTVTNVTVDVHSLVGSGGDFVVITKGVLKGNIKAATAPEGVDPLQRGYAAASWTGVTVTRRLALPRVRYLFPDVPDEINTLPGLRQVQRGDALGIGGVPRAVQNRSQQSSLRRGTAYY